MRTQAATQTPMRTTMTDPSGYERIEGVHSFSIVTHPDNRYRIVVVIWFKSGVQLNREIAIRQPLFADPRATATQGVFS